MENNRPTLHPAMLIAAASVTALSLAGVGVLTGVLPFGQKGAAPADPMHVAAMQSATASAQPGVPTAPAAAAQQAPTVAVNVNTTPAPAATAKAPAPRPVRVARSQEPADIDVYRYDRPPMQYRTAAPVSAPAPAICHDCGTVEAVREVTREPEGSGVGAVAGGVLGGVLGNQVGNGRGRDLATVIGVVGGAVAGNQIEKSQKRVVEYQVTVRFEDGTSRTFTQATPSAWRSGDRVKLENGVLVGRA